MVTTEYIMKHVFLYFCICISAMCFGQSNFTNKTYSISTTTHVYKIIKNDTLKLDLYRPSDYKGDLPLLIYVHGGGFASGQRNANYIADFATNIAEYGYAVASISYRLTMKDIGLGCEVKARKKIKAFNTASDDISYAVKYLTSKKNGFNIDESKVVLSGTSSGAEAVLNSVYNYDARILPRKFKYAGVISMTGALTGLDKVTNDSAIPTLLFHGTSDDLVPYYISAHHYCKEEQPGYLKLYGSRAIADRLKGLGESYYLYTIIGEPHHRSSAPMHENFNDILDFLFNDVLNKSRIRQTERTIGF